MASDDLSSTPTLMRPGMARTPTTSPPSRLVTRPSGVTSGSLHTGLSWRSRVDQVHTAPAAPAVGQAQ